MGLFGGLSNTLSIIGGIIAIVQVAIVIRDRGRLTWRVVDRSMRAVLKKMLNDSFKPDLIVGVGRGGAIVAGMLAGNLGHIPMFVVDTEVDRRPNISRCSIRNEHLLPAVEGKRVLVAVGELYSGEDLKAVVRFVEARNPREIITMALFSHPAASITTDYLGKMTERPLTAPWRMTDVYKSRRV